MILFTSLICDHNSYEVRAFLLVCQVNDKNIPSDEIVNMVIAGVNLFDLRRVLLKF